MASVPLSQDYSDGLQVVLSPAQLARIFDGRDMSETESMSTRAWGGLQGVLGVVEVIGAGALVLAPEPSMLSKGAGVLLGANGADNSQAGFRQMWTGHRTETYTYETTDWLAREMGVDHETAKKVARGVDIAVPLALSLGLGAARIASIRNGRIALIEHEAAQGAKIGGHTIAKHVAKSDAELLQRLADTAKSRRPPGMISTFHSLEGAERAIYQAVRANRRAITQWANAAKAGERQAFEFVVKGIGRGVARGTTHAVPLDKILVVLKKEAFNGKLYYILTSYPIP